MNAVTTLNGAFYGQTRVGVPDRRPTAWGDGVASLLGLLLVVGLGTLGGWAMVLVFKSLMQAQEVVIQNGFAFQR